MLNWKKCVAVAAVGAMLAVPARAEVDLSGLSLAELVELRQKVTMAMWETEEWQEVTVPVGVWVVGEDIPVGHWTIKATEGHYSLVKLDTSVDATGKHVADTYRDRYFRHFIYSATYRNYDESKHLQEIDLELQEGDYIEIEDASVIFTPYSGKPSLGFK